MNSAPVQERPSLGNEAARVRLAAHPGTLPHVLHLLAADPAVMVRAAVAMNAAAPFAVQAVLTFDTDERVRALLAAKMALLLPDLDATAQAEAYHHVRSTLATLVEDAAVRVRAAVANAVKAIPAAPRELILRLAFDPAPPVCDPVIRLSPMLTEGDLLALLATPPHVDASRAVAARRGLGATVADALVAQADSAAIHALLLNRTAAIQEATLDALVAQAGAYPEWHEPLVRHPALGKPAARALSALVAGELLCVLAERADLDPDLARELRKHSMTRLDSPVAVPPTEDLQGSLRRLHAAGALTEAVLLDAVRAGDARRVSAMLAIASGLPVAAVERAATLRSAKALVSLAWRAGFSMRAGIAVQAVPGGLEPGALLLPSPTGGFPLTDAEMTWQIEVLAAVRA